jgi:hypothetical protein
LTVAVFRPATARFYLRYLSGAGNADAELPWGDGNWLPVVGDAG